MAYIWEKVAISACNIYVFMFIQYKMLKNYIRQLIEMTIKLAVNKLQV